MSASTGGPYDDSGVLPTRALWGWSTPVQGQAQVVQSYPTVPGAPTKTGFGRADLEAYMGIPIRYLGSCPEEIPDNIVISWIRAAEDDIESETNLRLCQTWIAAPAAKSGIEASLMKLKIAGNYQQLGIDYDLEEAGYDFFFERWRDEGWGYTYLRWRPVKSLEVVDPLAYFSNNWRGVKDVQFIYPILNQFFHMPGNWIVQDQLRGYIRFVPAVSVQMLPLFALQMAFMGFAQSVPQGMWFQYTAGLTPNDYNSDWAFMKQLVMARAGIMAFRAMGTSLNMGAIELTTNVDGLMRRVRYADKGPFSAQISNLEDDAKRLMKRIKLKGGGLAFGAI